MKYETTLDFTAPIKASMHEIEHTFIEAIILVLIVVYVFLQSFRATIIPMLTVPVSLLGAFIAFRYSASASTPSPCSASYWQSVLL
jgi:HAE1 family hydrophobic/amphiphilic exporter-1